MTKVFKGRARRGVGDADDPATTPAKEKAAYLSDAMSPVARSTVRARPPQVTTTGPRPPPGGGGGRSTVTGKMPRAAASAAGESGDLGDKALAAPPRSGVPAVGPASAAAGAQGDGSMATWSQPA